MPYEPQHDKTNKMTCAPSKDSDQPGHPPSLIRDFVCAVWVAKDARFLHADSEDCSDWANAQADLSSMGAQVISLVLSRGVSYVYPEMSLLCDKVSRLCDIYSMC